MSTETDNQTLITRFPSDYIHLLMCDDVYENYHRNKKESKEKIEFNEEEWFVNEVYEYKTELLKMYTFKAVLYINDTKKQMVLAFKGLDAEFEDIYNDEGSFCNNIKGVLLNGVIPQLITCYDVVERAHKFAQEKDYYLSFTGFSNGGWLAEFAIYFSHRYLNGVKLKLKAVLFDSPGIIKSIQDTEPNVINRQNQYDINEIADSITCYLSSPNFSNAYNLHIGNTYRIFIDYDNKDVNEEEFNEFNELLDKDIQSIFTESLNEFEKKEEEVKKKDKKFKKLKNKLVEKIKEKIFNLDAIKKSKFFIMGLYSMFDYNIIKKFINEFDPSSGKPKYFERVKNWPIIKLELRNDYEKNFEQQIAKVTKNLIDIMPLPHLMTKPGETILISVIKNLTNLLFKKILPGMHLLINIIIELADGNIDFRQFDNYFFSFKIKDRNVLYNKIDEKKEKELQKENISLILECNYETEEANLKREKLFIAKPNIDWCLDELSRSEFKNSNQDFDINWLNKIKASYVRTIKNHELEIFIEIVDNKNGIDTIEKLKDNLIRFIISHPNLINILEHKQFEKVELQSNYDILMNNFIERENIFKEIDDIFEEDNHVIIQGIGGIGKSILATQYAHRASKLYKNNIIIRSIDSSTNEKIENEYILIAKLLNLEIEKNASNNLKFLIEKIYAILSSYGKKIILLIFDNLNENSDINNYLNGLKNNMKIIVTTRFRNVEKKWNKFKVLNMDEDKHKFNKELSKNYIEENLEKIDMNKSDIANLIDNIFKNNSSISGEKLNLSISITKDKYLREELDKIFEIIRTKSSKEIAKKILEDIEKTSKEYFLLGSLKYLDTNFISNKFLKSLIEIENDDEAEKIFNKLENRGLINRIKRNDIYGIYLHDNLIEIIDEIYFEKGIDYVIKKIYENFKVIDFDKFKQEKIEFNNHIIEIRNRRKNFKINIPEFSNFTEFFNIMSSREKKENYKEILKSYDNLFLSKNIENIHSKASMYNFLGSACLDLGEIEEGLQNVEAGLLLIPKEETKNYQQIKAYLNINKARAYYELGIKKKNQEYIEYIKMATKYYTESLEIDPYIQENTHYKLGMAYDKLGETKAAIENYKKNLDILPENITYNTYRVMTYNNLGLAYINLGEIEKAIQNFEKGLEISKESLLVINLLRMVELCYNLANAYFELGKREKKSEFFKEAIANYKIIDLSEKISLENHPGILESYNDLGKLYNDVREEYYKLELGERENDKEFLNKTIEYYTKKFESLKESSKDNHPLK